MASDEFDTKAECIEVLKNEINSQSKFNNTEFELINVNGFSNSRVSVFGVSSLDYKFVIEVGKPDVDKWTKRMIKSQLTKILIEQKKL